MNKTEKLSPNESLDIISKAIGQTKENLKDQSFYFILWGWIVFFASLLNYYLLEFTDYSRPYVAWMILIPIGWIVTFIYSTRREKTQKYETYLDGFLRNLWLVLMVAFILAVFTSVYMGVDPSTLTLLLAGVGTIVSGLSMKFRPLVIGGVLLWVFTIATLFVDDGQKLILNSVAVLLGYLVPAYILKNS